MKQFILYSLYLFGIGIDYKKVFYVSFMHNTHLEYIIAEDKEKLFKSSFRSVFGCLCGRGQTLFGGDGRTVD